MILGVCRTALRALRRRGEFPAGLEIGRYVSCRVSDVDRADGDPADRGRPIRWWGFEIVGRVHLSVGHRCDSRQGEFTREALAVEASHRIDADGVVATVERLVAGRAAPAHLRMDNGSELISAALRDWCRIWGTHPADIEPGAPWETPFVESFNSRLRDECLNTEDFANTTEARAVLEDWRTEYNTARPHQSLGMLTPAATLPSGRRTNTNPNTHNRLFGFERARLR